MKKYRLYALGADNYWLDALRKIADESIAVHTVYCIENYLNRIDQLGEADPEALFLVDASGQPDLTASLRKLREKGWHYVVAVTPAPSSRITRSMFRDAGVYDEWSKSYNPDVIRSNVALWLKYLERERDDVISKS